MRLYNTDTDEMIAVFFFGAKAIECVTSLHGNSPRKRAIRLHQKMTGFAWVQSREWVDDLLAFIEDKGGFVPYMQWLQQFI
jgi:hypothetical protein